MFTYDWSNHCILIVTRSVTQCEKWFSWKKSSSFDYFLQCIEVFFSQRNSLSFFVSPECFKIYQIWSRSGHIVYTIESTEINQVETQMLSKTSRNLFFLQESLTLTLCIVKNTQGSKSRYFCKTHFFRRITQSRSIHPHNLHDSASYFKQTRTNIWGWMIVQTLWINRQLWVNYIKNGL